MNKDDNPLDHPTFLDDQEAKFLSDYLVLLQHARGELADSLGTGYMSDSKSAVYALSKALESFPLSDPSLGDDLARMADAAWSAVTAPNSTHERAGVSLDEVVKLDRFVRRVLATREAMRIPLRKVISGGQTGVDRGALDAALALSFPCGGWCPEGRMASDGVLPDTYPLQELEGAGYRQRTIRNLTEADGTLIIYYGAPVGGTELTLAECIRRHKPYQLLDACEIPPQRAADIVAGFVGAHAIAVLNVAGPRHEREPLAREYAYAVVHGLVSRYGLARP